MMAPMKGDGQTHAKRSLEHFKTLYRGLDPAEIAFRCKLSFDGNAFSFNIMGKPHRAEFPDFLLTDAQGLETKSGYEKILFIRYLCEGRYTDSFGKQLSYREVPWGDLYFTNFDNRCIKRLARSFGENLEGFRKVMEETKGLRAQSLDKGGADCRAGYRFDFFNGFYMSFLVWAADDEFPSSAQILFDDNFPRAFTAEDMAVAGDAAIDYLKRYAAEL